MPTSSRAYDLVVIGTGSGGSRPAYKCREAGWRVAVVDELPYGGTCALRGCDPKKVLVGAAEWADWQRRLQALHIIAERSPINWAHLMRFKSSFTEPVPANRERRLAERGIDMFHGRARFLGPTTLEVGEDRLDATHVVIASGARPATLRVPGEEWLTTSTAFLDLPELPRRVVFVGGGFIAFEFAHLAARLGGSATMLVRGARALRGFDPDLVAALVTATRRAGIDLRFNTPVRGIARRGEAFVVTTESAGAPVEIEADLVLHGAGRVPNVDGLDLAAAGVDTTSAGIVVDAYLRSVSNRAVYAAGDVAATAGPPLTPVASLEGHVVASNLLKGDTRTADYTGVSSVVFSVPPLARVGLLEEEAERQGLRFRVEQGDTANWYSSRRVGEDTSGYKVLIDEGSGRILGAHLLGSHSEELINLFALAVRHGIPAVELKRMPYAYPSRASDVPYMV